MSTAKRPPAEDYVPSEHDLQSLLMRVSSASCEQTAIVGFPGVGKSSLLNFIATTPFSELRPYLGDAFRLKPHQLVAVAIDCREAGPEEHLLEHVLKAINSALQGRDAALATPTKTGGSTVTAMDAALDRCQQAGLRVVLLADNFDQAFARLAPEDARHLRPRNSFLMVMALENPIEVANPLLTTSPYFQAMYHLWMKGLSRAEAIKLVETVGDAPKSDAEYVASLVMPYPVVLRRIAQILRDERMRRGLTGNAQLNADWRRLLTMKLGEDLQQLFDFYWNRLDGSQRDTLRGLIDDPKPLSEPAAYLLEKRGLTELSSANRAVICGDLFKEFVANRKSPPTNLTQTESQLYAALAAKPFETCSFQDLFRTLWKDAEPSGPAAARRVQVAVSRLRQKLKGQHRGTIVSVRDHGYRLELENRAR